MKSKNLLVVADSGSSKTDWAVIENKKVILRLSSKGINPFFITTDEIYLILLDTFKGTGIIEKISQVYFYGAGCIRNHNSEIVEIALKNFFKNAVIEANDDMIGAARAIFGKSPGIACILGTGANSCKYDGISISEKISALGFILGDEGSGAWFGKTLINNYFKKIMPEDVLELFRKSYASIEPEILTNVYKKPRASSFLAKFTWFLSENIGHPYVQELLYRGFSTFIENNVIKYSDYKRFNIGFTGSVAWYFSDVLKNVCSNYQLHVSKIIERPIESLINYHNSIV
ncbi:MAG: ATPase [Bacteroidales bacterium]